METKKTRQILKSTDGKTNVKTVFKADDKHGITFDPKKKVRIISLGGLYEIGKNTWCIECGDEIMLMDAGLAFPTVDMIGVDLVLPKLNYLVENKSKIKAMIVTHGHEDHIGGIVPMLREINIPVIYSPHFALALLKNKLREADMSEQKTKEVAARETIKIGSNFAVTYVRNNHSIADSFCIIIDTPAGRIVHSGDFKFDHSPIDNQYFDIATLSKAGEDGVTILFSDSTNAEKSSYTPSEKSVIPKIREHIEKAPQRIIITTFASQVHRIKIIMQIAQSLGKKVAVMGRSMVTLTSISKELGYMSIPENFIVRPEDVSKVPPEELIILTTGSQGEQFAALSRIARDEHKQVKITPGDTVIMSASPIPGNEKSVNGLINNLFARGAEVIYGRDENIHVSGHASQEEQKILLNLTKPKYFMPCHGEYRMLVKHGELGVKCGVPKENIFLMNNGDVLQMQNNECKLVDRVEAGIVMIDNAQVGDLDQSILLERKLLAQEGFLSIVATINSEGDLLGAPKVYSKGLVLSSSEARDDFLKKINTIAIDAIKNSNHKEIEKLEVDVKSEIHKYVDDKLHRHPLLEVILMQGSSNPAPRVVGLDFAIANATN